MSASEIQATLTRFIVDKLLDGEGDELDEHTPLLEWGVIDSIAMVSLLDFIKTEWKVEVPDDAVSPRNFASIAALERLVTQLVVGAGADA